MTTNSILIKDLDYIINDDGNLVFTTHYLKKRGHCCQSGCLHCPYGYGSTVDPNVPAEFNDAWDDLEYSDENEESDD